MSRQQLITNFQTFINTNKEEVKSHICKPPYDWMDEDDWEEEPPKSVPINGSKTLWLETNERGENDNSRCNSRIGRID